MTSKWLGHLLKSAISKLRLFRSGVRWSDRFFLLKNSLRFHLAKCGIRLDWTQKELELRIRIGHSKFIVRCRDDPYHMGVFGEIFGDRQYEPIKEFDSIETVLDLGANLGVFSLFCGSFFPDARYVCVEPNPDNVRYLTMNLERNLRYFSLKSQAVTAPQITEPVTLFQSFSSTAHSLLPSQNTTNARISVMPVGLPALITEFGERQLDLLKCDIEGAEADAFDGVGRETLGRVRNLVIEYHSEPIKARLMGLLSDSFRLVKCQEFHPGSGLLWMKNKRAK